MPVLDLMSGFIAELRNAGLPKHLNMRSAPRLLKITRTGEFSKRFLKFISRFAVLNMQ
jgi:hypothetical protein